MPFDFSAGELGRIDREIHALIQKLVLGTALSATERQVLSTQLAELQMQRVRQSEPRLFQEIDERLRA